MAQRESSVFLYLFVVAMMLFVLMTVAFFLKHNEIPIIQGEVETAEAKSAAFEKINKELMGDNKKLRAFIVGENQAVDFPKADGLIQDMSSELERVTAWINESNKDLNRNSDVSFTFLIQPYSKFKGIFDTYRPRAFT